VGAVGTVESSVTVFQEMMLYKWRLIAQEMLSTILIGFKEENL
jgi:hypothetical protein